jgi:chemotaxis protein histidine kinase CheA
MTSDGTTLSEGVGNSIIETVKTVRANLKRGENLSTSDVAYLAIDPVLEDLGWNLRDPREIRRDGGDTIILMSGNTVAATIKVLAAGKPLVEKADKIAKADGDWIITTNGLDWNIYYAKHTKKPIRQAMFEKPADARSSVDALSIIEKEAMKKTDPADVWAMSINADVTRALQSHLDVSDALVSAVAAQLGSDSGADASDVRAALSRLSVSVSQKPADEASPAKKPAAKKTAKAKKPAAAKKTAAKKPATAASKTAGKTATAKKPAAKKSAAKKPATPAKAPDDMAWPDDATHIMRRKGAVAFIRHDTKTGISHLLEGSLLSSDIGKSLAPNLIKMREDAKFEGGLVDESGMLKVTKAMEFNGPRLAASFAAGAQVRELSAWKTKGGKDLTLPEEEKAAAASAPKKDRKEGTLGLSLSQGATPEPQQEVANG